MQRSLELPAVIAVSVSAMLGSGIFVLPGLAATATGPSLWLAYVLASLLVMPAAFSKSELSTAMPESGGTYVYLDRAFGPLAGTVAGLGLWLSLLLKGAFALVGMGAYLSVVAAVPFNTVALLVITAIVLVNIRGIKGVGRAQLVMVVVSIVTLIGMTVVGWRSFSPALLTPAILHGPGGLLAATGLVFVSYAGVTKIAAIAEEVRHPERNLPRGILFSLVFVGVIYTVVTLVLAGTIPLAQLQGDLHPIFTLAVREGGLALGVPVAMVGALTMAAMANAGLLAASRFPFAMSRDNLLPPSLGYLHPVALTPAVAVAVSGVMLAAAVLLLDVERIAKLASSFVILIFMIECLTVIVLRESRVAWYKPPYRSPLYPALQVAGILGGLLLLIVMGPLVIVCIASITVPGILLWFLYGRRRTLRRGVVAQRGPRQKLLRGTDPGIVTICERALVGKAEVLVPLFGRERSPEMLVELANALADGGHTQVVHLTEIPEQTALQAALAETDARTDLFARRLTAMSEEKHLSIAFNAMVSHDIVKTVHQLSLDLRARWLVVEWGGRTSGLFTLANPLGWLSSHVACNLATFADSGVRDLRKILVLVEPGPHDSLVVSTADHLARIHNAKLTFARFVPHHAPPTTVQASADYLDQIRELFEAPAQPTLIRGRDAARAIGHRTGAFDLLVVGEAPAGWLGRRFFETELDRITAWAACSVLRLQTPRSKTHEPVTEHRRRRPTGESFRLTHYVDTSCLLPGLGPLRKEALFAYFAKTFAVVIDDVDAETILAALWARERMQNTSIGHGLALPHATIHTDGRSRLGVFTTDVPVKYQAPDGQPADVFLVTLGAPRDRGTHLLLLSHIARMVEETDVLAQLRLARTPQEMWAALEKASATS